MAVPHGGNWDSTLTLGSLVPGLSSTLKNMQAEVMAAKTLEQQAQAKLTSQILTKLNELNSAISLATKLFNDITNNLDTSGVSVMNIEPNIGGYNGLITDLSLATNKPLQQTTGFYAGTVLLVTAPDITQTAALYAKLKTLFTLQ